MAATKILVSVTGPLGLDDPDRMLADLEAATGLSWRRQPVEEGKVLSGALAEIVLVAVATKATEIAWDAVQQVVRRWHRERLDPPQTSVAAEPVPDRAADADAPGTEGEGTRISEESDG